MLIMYCILLQLIGDDGTIGITYFTTNKYTTAIQAMIRQINVTSHPPFRYLCEAKLVALEFTCLLHLVLINVKW